MPDLPDEDDAYERDVQRGVDDATEVKRRASGFSPEQLSLQNAFIEGARAGSMGLSPSLNPYQNRPAEHAEWERGRFGALGNELAKRVKAARRVA